MRRDKFFLKSCGQVFAALLIFCAALTGCANREAEFLSREETGETAGSEGDWKTEKSQQQTAENGQPQQESGVDSNGQPQQDFGEADKVEVIMITPTPLPEIYVDVCGAVKSPGVYSLKDGSRVFQAIEAAGGFLLQAADNYVNRAGSLTDGQQIYIPTREEAEEWSFPPGESQNTKQTEGMLPGSEARNSGSTAESDSAPIDLNTADENRLTTLPGIGAAKAKAIIAYREANGGFSAIEELMNVEGIKEGTFSKIKDDIEVR